VNTSGIHRQQPVPQVAQSNARAPKGLDIADDKNRDELKKSQRGGVLDGPPIAPEPEPHPQLKNRAQHQGSQARTVLRTAKHFYPPGRCEPHIGFEKQS
jgi:hypothetical protein